jgi:hypothetical protein
MTCVPERLAGLKNKHRVITVTAMLGNWKQQNISLVRSFPGISGNPGKDDATRKVSRSVTLNQRVLGSSPSASTITNLGNQRFIGPDGPLGTQPGLQSVIKTAPIYINGLRAECKPRIFEIATESPRYLAPLPAILCPLMAVSRRSAFRRQARKQTLAAATV